MTKETNENWKSEEQRAERKERLSSQTTASGQKKPIRKKMSWGGILGILLLVLVIAGVAASMYFGNGYKERKTVVATVNGEPVTALKANFYTGLAFNSSVRTGAFTDDARSILSMVFPFGGESKPLRDSLIDNFRSQIQELVYLQQQAKAAGTEPTQEDKESIDGFFKQLSATAKSSQMTMSDLLQKLYGPGASEETLRPFLEENVLVNRFQQNTLESYSFTDDEIEAAYQADKDQYDLVDYRLFVVNAATPEVKKPETTGENTQEEKADESNQEEKSEESESKDTEEKAPELTEEEQKAQAMAEAKAKADQMLEQVTDEESFKAEARKLTEGAEAETLDEKDATLVQNARKNMVESVVGDWLFDSARKAGDKTVVETQQGYTVLYFIQRQKDTRPDFSSRHLLVKVEAAEGQSEDEAREAAKAKAEDLLKQYQAGEKTEDAFAELAKANSDDPGSKSIGGLYENVKPGNFVPAYEAWCLDPARQEGDVDIVYVKSSNYEGYHIIYFKGVGEPAWKQSIISKLKADKFEKMIEDAKASFTYEENEKGMELVLPNYDRAEMESARASLAEQSSQPESSDETSSETSEATTEETTKP